MIPLNALMMTAALLAVEPVLPPPSSQSPAAFTATAAGLPPPAPLPAGWEMRPPATSAPSPATPRTGEARGRRSDRFFAEDKLMHFFTSFAATTLAASGARVVGFDARESRRLGVAAGAVVGIGKEIHDLGRPGETASVLDLIWDAGGVALAAAVARQLR